MTGPQPTFLRKAGKFFVKAVIAFVILVCLLVVYAELKIRWAKKQVEAYLSARGRGNARGGSGNEGKGYAS